MYAWLRRYRRQHIASGHRDHVGHLSGINSDGVVVDDTGYGLGNTVQQLVKPQDGLVSVVAGLSMDT
jgi:hypothetical protein